jgi:hypothetical protein
MRMFLVADWPEQHLQLRVPDYGFVIAAYSISMGLGARDLSVVRVSHDGEVLASCRYNGAGYGAENRDQGYWRWVSAEPFGKGIADYFYGPNPPIKEQLSVQPVCPMPEKSERHAPMDSFSNVWLISFALNERQHVKVSVYDTSGCQVRTIIDGEYCTGKHSETLDGWTLAPGIYFLRAETRDMFVTQKLALIR